MPQSYARAFGCSRCPGNAGPEGCPAWTELIETNASGEVRVSKGCLLQLAPRIMVEVIKASNRPAAAVESMRNEVAAGLSLVASTLPGMVAAAAARALAAGEAVRAEGGPPCLTGG